MKKQHIPSWLISFILFSFSYAFAFNDLLKNAEDGFVDNGAVKIHYVTLGQGPLIVMLHGFPDFWYTWRDQMEILSAEYQVVAIDLRGYNKSDKPKGVENYTMRNLISDVAAVIQHFPQKKAILVGHDWGGAIAWQVAIWRPALVEKLIVLSTPHPNGLRKELISNDEQQKNSQYARDYQKADAHKELSAEELAGWITDDSVRQVYLDAFRRSDFEAMLNYYKASFPKVNSNSGTVKTRIPPAKVQCSTLGIFGLKDKALLASGWNNTWDWIDNDLTLISIPEAGHFVQRDASASVSKYIMMWLNK
jgi:epoxide hydrolase 4